MFVNEKITRVYLELDVHSWQLDDTCPTLRNIKTFYLFFQLGGLKQDIISRKMVTWKKINSEEAEMGLKVGI